MSNFNPQATMVLDKSFHTIVEIMLVLWNTKKETYFQRSFQTKMKPLFRQQNIENKLQEMIIINV